MEFFDADGKALGRLGSDQRQGAMWEEDPGQPRSFGRKPSAAIAGNEFLGKFADGILAADTALALRDKAPGEQTAAPSTFTRSATPIRRTTSGACQSARRIDAHT